MPKHKKTLYIAVQTEPNAIGSHFTSHAYPNERRASAYWNKAHQVIKIEIETADQDEEEATSNEQK